MLFHSSQEQGLTKNLAVIEDVFYPGWTHSYKSQEVACEVSFPILDADGHLEENYLDWKERLPKEYKDRAPKRRPKRQWPTAHNHRS